MNFVERRAPYFTLLDVWRVVDGNVMAEGGAATISDLLADKLMKVKVDWSGWRTLYQHKETRQFWELDYPHSETHGGGPRRLSCLAIALADEWDSTRK